MGKMVFICDGQGAVEVNAGKDLYASDAAFRDGFDTINEYLDVDNADLSWGTMSRKVKADPHLSHAYAISHQYALFKMLRARGVPCDVITGHSLGEICALVLSGAVPLEQGVRLIETRGRLFKRNMAASGGSDMVALIGDRSTILRLVSQLERSIEIFVANINSDRQVIVSVANGDVGTLFQSSFVSGVRPVKLNLGNGCHSSFVEAIHHELASAIANLDIVSPKVCFYSASFGTFSNNPDVLREQLVRHLLEPVDWFKGMKNLLDLGCRTFYEIGQSKILKGLLADIDRTSSVYTVHQYKGTRSRRPSAEVVE